MKNPGKLSIIRFILIVIALILLFKTLFFFRAKGPGIVIGFSQVGEHNSWNEAQSLSILNAAKYQGYKMLYHNGEMKQFSQVEAVRYFIARKVDVIVISPLNRSGWQSVLGTAYDAGIPVVLLDRGVDCNPDYYTSRISYDFENEGRMGADAIAELIQGRGDVVQISGTSGSSAGEGRSDGFDSWISRYRNINLIATRDGGFNRIEGDQAVSDLLRKLGQEVNALFLQNEEMTIGALSAINRIPWAQEKPPVLVACGGTEEIISLLDEGRIDALVLNSPNMGNQLIDLVELILNGDPVDPVIRLSSKIIYNKERQSNED